VIEDIRHNVERLFVDAQEDNVRIWRTEDIDTSSFHHL